VPYVSPPYHAHQVDQWSADLGSLGYLGSQKMLSNLSHIQLVLWRDGVPHRANDGVARTPLERAH
jgi:hypothetical protein